MTHLIQILDEISSETGCAILFLHHVNKLATISGQGGNQAASRGSSALVDNIRYQINLSIMTEKEAEKMGVEDTARHEFVKLESSKQNYAKNTGYWLKKVYYRVNYQIWYMILKRN